MFCQRWWEVVHDWLWDHTVACANAPTETSVCSRKHAVLAAWFHRQKQTVVIGEDTEMATFLQNDLTINAYVNHISEWVNQTILCFHFFRATAECFAHHSHRLGVCPSVTLVICIKTVQARITKSLLWAAPRSLVYPDKISCCWVQGFSSNEGERGVSPLRNVILPLLAQTLMYS